MPQFNRTIKTAVVVIVVLVIAAAVVVVVHKKSASAVSAKPLSITSAPAGLIGASSPNASGQIWLLVNSAGHANVQLQNISSPKPVLAFPVSNSATSIASRFASNVAVGLGAQGTGAVVFYSTVNLRVIATTPVSGPVVTVVPSGSSDYDALVRTGSVASVAVINAAHQVIDTVPMPSGTVSIAVSSDGNTVYALQDSGTVSVVDVPSTHLTQSFATSSGARELALSPDGTLLYELKGPSVSDNVGVIDVATKTQKYVLPAPASCVAIEVSVSGNALYDVVGNAQFGNIQVFSSSR